MALYTVKVQGKDWNSLEVRKEAFACTRVRDLRARVKYMYYTHW